MARLRGQMKGAGGQLQCQCRGDKEKKRDQEPSPPIFSAKKLVRSCAEGEDFRRESKAANKPCGLLVWNPLRVK